jgi:hypothetical protein
LQEGQEIYIHNSWWKYSYLTIDPEEWISCSGILDSWLLIIDDYESS